LGTYKKKFRLLPPRYGSHQGLLEPRLGLALEQVGLALEQVGLDSVTCLALEQVVLVIQHQQHDLTQAVQKLRQLTMPLASRDHKIYIHTC